MSDISKCDGLNCSVKHNCYRYTAPDEIYQSYILIEEDMVWPNCEFYLPEGLSCDS